MINIYLLGYICRLTSDDPVVGCGIRVSLPTDLLFWTDTAAFVADNLTMCIAHHCCGVLWIRIHKGNRHSNLDQIFLRKALWNSDYSVKMTNFGHKLSLLEQLRYSSNCLNEFYWKIPLGNVILKADNQILSVFLTSRYG